MRLYHKDKIVILIMLDLLAMIMAFILSLLVGHRSPALSLIQYYAWSIVTLVISTVIMLFILDLYSLNKIPDRFIVQVLYVVLGMLLSAILVTFIFFFLRNTVPRAVFLLYYIFSLIFIVATRFLFGRLTIAAIYWRLLIVGESAPTEKIVRIIQERKYLHSKIVGYLTDRKEQLPFVALKCFGPVDQLLRVVDRETIDHVVVATHRIDDKLTNILLDCMKKKVKVTDFKQFIETTAGKVPIDYLSDSWFFEMLSSNDKRYYWYAKRMTDILASLIGIFISLPFLPIIALLTIIDSAGPVFYSQARVGRDNKLFQLWKLRTMVQDADKNNIYWTTDNDSRITRFGKYIRKMRIDELPQLYNILKGDMTLIGPRPEALSLVQMYRKEIPYYMERHMVTPGITGWAQINYPYGNSIEDTREKLKYDFYYIKHRNLILDTIIVLRTIRTVLTGTGAL